MKINETFEISSVAEFYENVKLGAIFKLDLSEIYEILFEKINPNFL